MTWGGEKWKLIGKEPVYRVKWEKKIKGNNICTKGEMTRTYKEEDTKHLRDTIQEWLESGVVVQVDENRSEIGEDAAAFRNFLHVVRPKDKKPRVVLDGRATNEFIDKGALILPTVHEIALGAMEPEKKVLLAKIDLKAGFHQMRAAEDSQHHFWFEGKIYKFLVLPFGPRDGPACFQECTQELGKWLANYFKMKVYVYLDDFIMIAEEGTQTPLERIIKELETFGVEVSPKKCESWARKQEVLGIVIDLDAGCLNLPQRKKDQLDEFAKDFISSELRTSKQVARVAGALVAASVAFPMTLLMARPIYEELKETFAKIGEEMPEEFLEMRAKDIESHSWFNCDIQVTHQIQMSVARAAYIVKDAKYAKRIRLPRATKIWLQFDASEYAVGSVMAKKDVRGASVKRLREENSEAALNSRLLEATLAGASSFKRETWALLQAVRDLVEVKKDQDDPQEWIRVRAFTDNQALSYRWNRGVADQETMSWLLEIAELCIEWKLDLTLEHIMREENEIADELSKPSEDKRPLFVEQQEFDGWITKLGERDPIPNIDWFASQEQHRLPKYCTRSWRRNAFTWEFWKKDVVYAFPPMALVKRAYRLWCESRSNTLYMVVPVTGKGIFEILRGKAEKEWDIKVEGATNPNWRFKILKLTK